MFIDALNQWVAPGSPLSLVAAAGVAVPSSVIDILGVGVGVAPPVIIGTATTFGSDLGIGGFEPEMVVTVGTAFTTGTSATLTAQFQAAADDGTNNPSTWVTQMETGAIAAASLTANTRIARFKFPPAWTPGLRPRFLRWNFAVLTATTFTAGTIANAMLTIVRDDYGAAFASRNYTVA